MRRQSASGNSFNQSRTGSAPFNERQNLTGNFFNPSATQCTL